MHVQCNLHIRNPSVTKELTKYHGLVVSMLASYLGSSGLNLGMATTSPD